MLYFVEFRLGTPNYLQYLNWLNRLNILTGRLSKVNGILLIYGWVNSVQTSYLPGLQLPCSFPRKGIVTVQPIVRPINRAGTKYFMCSSWGFWKIPLALRKTSYSTDCSLKHKKSLNSDAVNLNICVSQVTIGINN